MEAFVRVLAVLFLIIILVASGTTVYHNLEGWSYVDSFYFTSITVMTIGYGDFHPTKNTTKIFTVFFAFIGISLMLFSFTVVAETYIKHSQKRLERHVFDFGSKIKENRRPWKRKKWKANGNGGRLKKIRNFFRKKEY